VRSSWNVADAGTAVVRAASASVTVSRRATALVEAMHVLTADRTVHALLKNPYEVELVRHGDAWVIRRMAIANIWYTGDPVAIFGG
jgi:hypothetical protein